MINISNIYKWLELAGNKLNDNSKTKLALELIYEELYELHVGVINNDNDEIKDAVGDLIWVLSNLLYFKGITIEEFKDYFKLIEESNYSKFCRIN
jgi:NTP pyrophosphatase (non-canonical NTP hydrolase)